MNKQELEDLKEILGKADFAPLVPREKLNTVLPRFYPMSFNKGDLIMQQGKHAGAFLVIADGALEVFVHDEEHREVVLNILKPVNYVGEMALLAGEVRNASVRAAEEVKAYLLGKAAFDQLLSDVPALKEHFQKVARKRRRGMQKKFKNPGSLSKETKSPETEEINRQ